MIVLNFYQTAKTFIVSSDLCTCEYETIKRSVMIHKDRHILFVLEHLSISQTHVVGKAVNVSKKQDRNWQILIDS